MEARYRASQKLAVIWGIYFSKTEHCDVPNRPPAYYLEWARQKEISVPWLDWAVDNELILVPESGETTNQKMERKLGQRERNTLLCFIAALLNRLSIDPKQRGIAKKLVGCSEEMEVSISDDKVGKSCRAWKTLSNPDGIPN